MQNFIMGPVSHNCTREKYSLKASLLSFPAVALLSFTFETSSELRAFVSHFPERELCNSVRQPILPRWKALQSKIIILWKLYPTFPYLIFAPIPTMGSAWKKIVWREKWEIWSFPFEKSFKMCCLCFRFFCAISAYFWWILRWKLM